MENPDEDHFSSIILLTMLNVDKTVLEEAHSHSRRRHDASGQDIDAIDDLHAIKLQSLARFSPTPSSSRRSLKGDYWFLAKVKIAAIGLADGEFENVNILVDKKGREMQVWLAKEQQNEQQRQGTIMRSHRSRPSKLVNKLETATEIENDNLDQPISTVSFDNIVAKLVTKKNINSSTTHNKEDEENDNTNAGNEEVQIQQKNNKNWLMRLIFPCTKDANDFIDMVTTK